MIEIKPHTNGDFKVVKIEERLIDVTSKDSREPQFISQGKVEHLIFVGSLEKCEKLKKIIE